MKLEKIIKKMLEPDKHSTLNPRKRIENIEKGKDYHLVTLITEESYPLSCHYPEARGDHSHYESTLVLIYEPFGIETWVTGNKHEHTNPEKPYKDLKIDEHEKFVKIEYTNPDGEKISGKYRWGLMKLQGEKENWYKLDEFEEFDIYDEFTRKR